MKYFIILFFGVFLCATYAPVYTDATLTGDGSIDTPLGINRGGEITPDTINAEQDDYDPTSWDEASVVRLISDRQIGITSFAAPDASTSPQEKTLINVGPFMIYLPMDHPDGTAANRLTGYGADYKLYPGASCKILYDGTSLRWRVIGEENTEGKTGVFYEWSPASVADGDWGIFGQVFFNGGARQSVTSTTSLPGAFGLSTATGAAGFASCYFAKNMTGYSAFGSAHNYTETFISIPTLSDGTEEFTVELQLIIASGLTAGTLEPNNSIGIRYSHGINGGEWELFSQNNAGTESVADCNVTVAAATLYNLRIEHDKANAEARAYINGNYVGRVTSSMPNAVACGARVAILKSAGTTARTLNVHSFSAGAIY